MKVYFLSSIALIFALFTSSVYAQEKIVEQKENYVILTKKIPQLQPIFLSAEALAKEDGEQFGEFKIIICGKTVQELTDKEMMQKYVEKAAKLNVELVVCGFSLHKFGVEKNNISPELKIVENGILYNLQLQKKGYTSLSL
ncbi:MAG TPA: sulfur reduction protein DsrE [Salinimicrobium sp.]|nr:sulfur reduction protein DsrE [Salinimicrobium sp.]